MNIACISTRLAGTDGVSLETAKMAVVLRRLGHHIFYCAGELDKPEALQKQGIAGGRKIPGLHFTDETAVALGRRAFGTDTPDPELLPDINRRAADLKQELQRFVTDFQIDFIIVQNAFAIPMQLPLAQALTLLLAETGLPALAHNHDFFWERVRFARNNVPEFLNRYFPPDLPHLRHAVINSAAQRDLRQRRGLDSILLPNVFDFATPAPGIDGYNADFRQAIDIEESDWLILQPTRVVPRKGIELAIECVARLNDPRAKLVITHHAGDEGVDYLNYLIDLAQQKGVDLRYEAAIVGDSRGETADGRKRYALWDTYPHADFVMYPSLYEGFGNALIETIYFRLPALVNRYSVYVDDIGPHGFQFVEIDGAVTDEAVTAVRDYLHHPPLRTAAADHNYALGARHFSYETLQELLRPIFNG